MGSAQSTDNDVLEDSKVYCYAWKTVNGFATSSAHALNTILTLGRSPIVAGIPDFEHMAIVVHGYTFEFGSMGVTNKRVENGRPKSFCTVQPDGRSLYLGRTRKTLEEFFEWYEESEEKYTKESYDVVKLNCIHWARDAANFLGVSHDPAWDKLQYWIKFNEPQARIAAKLLGSSSSGSS